MLKKIPLFNNLNQRQLKQIARVTYEYPVPVKAGKVLVQEGDPGQEFFMILDGVAQVKKAGRVIDTLAKGAHFGEVSLIDGRRRSATVVAETDVRLMGLSRKSFHELLNNVPGLSNKLLDALCDYLRMAEETISDVMKYRRR